MIGKILSNVNVDKDGIPTSIFDLTEEIDSDNAIKLLKKVAFD